jgi:hypothetical protein
MTYMNHINSFQILHSQKIRLVWAWCAPRWSVPFWISHDDWQEAV